MQGNIGKPGAGLCPVRGHSNVQGDRTMGIWERPPQHFLDAIEKEFGFDPPREDGLDTVASIRALSEGKAKVFFGMGGNFVAAAPDTHVTEDAMRRADLTVQVSTKLNRSHVVAGQEALILPTMGRTEKDLTGGKVQRITVEDSMSAVHASHGPLKPASKHLRSEVDIVCTMAEAVLAGRHDIPWHEFRADYTAIRRRIANVVPGCAAYDEKVDQPGGFVLPHPPRDSRTFPTEPGKAVFTVSPIDVLHVPEGRLLMQTLRSHDQFNTTIYGLDDRYRGVSGGRRVVFVHPEDITALGLAEGQVVDLVSEWTDGSERRAPAFRVVPYDQPRGCAASYYPETNPLVPLDSTAVGSNCPTSKSIIVRLEPESGGAGSSGAPRGCRRVHRREVRRGAPAAELTRPRRSTPAHPRPPHAAHHRAQERYPMTVRTLGVEEELLLLDPTTRQVSSRSHEVIKRFREHGAGRDHVARATVATDELDQELFLHQIETRTDPTDDLQDALAQVVAARRTAGEAARDADLAVVACGVVPMDGFEPVVTRNDRYQDMVERFGAGRPHRRHLRDARARRHRLRRGGRAGHRPAGALAAGDPRDQRELAVLRGARHRLRVVALAGVEPLAERRADPAVRLGRGLPRGLRAARRARRRPRPGDALLRRPAGGGAPDRRDPGAGRLHRPGHQPAGRGAGPRARRDRRDHRRRPGLLAGRDGPGRAVARLEVRRLRAAGAPPRAHPEAGPRGGAERWSTPSAPRSRRPATSTS